MGYFLYVPYSVPWSSQILALSEVKAILFLGRYATRLVTYHRRTRGVRLMGLSPFWEKVCLTYDEYFYFYFIPT